MKESPINVVVDLFLDAGSTYQESEQMLRSTLLAGAWTAGYATYAMTGRHPYGVLFLDHLSAVKRSLLLAKWKKSRKGQTGYLKEVTPEPAGEL